MNLRERKAGKTSGTGPNSRTDQRPPDAPTPAALYEAGLQHLRAGRHLDAQICCGQALAIDPGHAGTLQLMGLLSLQAGDRRSLLAAVIVLPARPELGDAALLEGQDGSSALMLT